MNILIKTKIGKNEYLFPLKKVAYNVSSGIEQIIFWNLCDKTNCKSISYPLNTSYDNHKILEDLNRVINELQEMKSVEFLKNNKKLVKLNYIILNLKVIDNILQAYAVVPNNDHRMLMAETLFSIQPYVEHKFNLDIHSKLCIQNTSGDGNTYVYKKIFKKKGTKNGKRS